MLLEYISVYLTLSDWSRPFTFCFETKFFMFGATCTGPARFLYRIERAKRDIYDTRPNNFGITDTFNATGWLRRVLLWSVRRTRATNIGVSQGKFLKIKIEHENWTREFRWFVATNKTKRHRNPVHSCAVRDGRGCADTPKMDRDVEESFPSFRLLFLGTPETCKRSWRRRLASVARCRPIEFTYDGMLTPSHRLSRIRIFNRINKKKPKGKRKNSSTLPWCRKIPASSWSYTLAPICLFDFSCFFHFPPSSLFFARQKREKGSGYFSLSLFTPFSVPEIGRAQCARAPTAGHAAAAARRRRRIGLPSTERTNPPI